MIKDILAPPTYTTATTPSNVTNPVRAPRFPSSVLIAMGVVACFLATFAFASALAQAGSVGLFIIPSSVGFMATIPYYIIIHSNNARKQKLTQGMNDASVSGLSLLITPSPIHVFILAAIIPAGIILSTFVAGLEWMVLLFIAVKDTKESWDAEPTGGHTALRRSDILPVYQGFDEALHLNKNSLAQRYAYFASFIFATVALVFSISLSYSCLVNLIACLMTAPYHISVFVLSGSPRRSSTPLLSHSKNAAYTLLLGAIWCCAVVVDALSYGYPFQGVLSGMFGGIECIVTGYIAICCILEGLAARENQIQLPADT